MVSSGSTTPDSRKRAWACRRSASKRSSRRCCSRGTRNSAARSLGSSARSPRCTPASRAKRRTRASYRRNTERNERRAAKYAVRKSHAREPSTGLLTSVSPRARFASDARARPTRIAPEARRLGLRGSPARAAADAVRSCAGRGGLLLVLRLGGLALGALRFVHLGRRRRLLGSIDELEERAGGVVADLVLRVAHDARVAARAVAARGDLGEQAAEHFA